MSVRASAAFCLLCASCGTLDERETVYVGALADDDHDTSVALAVRGSELAVYVCGSDPAHESYAGWFAGGSLPLRRDGSIIDGRVGPDGAAGRLTGPDGASFAWSAAPIPEHSLENLYATWDDGCLTGVIVAASGTGAPVVRGSWCSSDGEVRQVTPVMPVHLVDGRLPVVVMSETGERWLEVAPLQP